jgi:two-component system, chemotaxis family, sensor histidine kinase and response regulator PixL
MAINPDIRDQAYQFFIEEAPELLQVLEAGLMTLGQDHSTGQIHNLMRAAHTLKGGSASVGLEAVATLAHRLETILRALYSDELTIDTDLENQLLQAYDCLRLPLTEQIATGSFDADHALAIAEPIFTQLETRCGAALTATEAYIPSSTDLGINMITSIFEVDVTQGLEHLSEVVTRAHVEETAEALQGQLNVFAGFAELFNLSDFAELVRTAQGALDRHPTRAVEIARLALVDFQEYSQAIVHQSHTRPMTPSRMLIDLSNITEIDAIFQQPETNGAPSPTTFIDIEEIFVGPTIHVNGNITNDQIVSEEEIELINAVETGEPAEEIDISLLESLFSYPPATLDATNPDLSERFLEESDEFLEEIDYLEFMADEQSASDALLSVESHYDEFNDTLDQQTIPPIDALPPAAESIDANPFLAAGSSLVPASPLQSDRPMLSLPESRSLSPVRNRSGANSPPDQQEPVAPPLTVRVDSERLERMNRLIGELSINHNSLFLQSDQLQGTLRELLNRFARFQTLANQLRQFSDQTIVASERYQPRSERAAGEVRPTPAAGAPTGATISSLSDFSSTAVEFDSLEIDSYGWLHAQLQGILEEVVQLEEAVDDVALYVRQSTQMLQQQRPTLTYLQDEITWARMVPIGEVLNRFPRMLRDLSSTYGKPVELKLVGTEVLVDRAILEKLYNPLLHLIRNAFDHGIEPPAIRQHQGKSEQGTIEIRTYHRGNQTIIEVRDDGQGLNLDRIRSRVFELGWLTPDQLAVATPARLYDFVFEPGFSTARRVSKLSGRGVGLDVVRSQLKAVKGTVTVESFPGKGTTFTMRLPLMLTISKLVICTASSATLALSVEHVEEVLTPRSDQTREYGAQRFLYWQQQIVPIYRLRDLLDYRCPLPETAASKALASITTPKNWSAPVIVFHKDQQIFALEVDQVITEQELVIKPFSATIAAPSYTYGCTILADGSLVPVIDAIALLSQILGTDTHSTAAESSSAPQPLNTRLLPAAPPAVSPPIKTVQPPTILVVDDAATLRRSLAVSLERAGFRVVQARHGQEAIEQLQQRSSVKLVVCDIEMPNMNGFEFLNHRRQDPQLTAIPVVILTSRSNEKHRWLATQLGAAAYFTKPYLEQEFLSALTELIQAG